MEQTLTYDLYQKGLADGRLLGLKCDSCGKYTCPPKAVCRECGGKNLTPAEMSGKAQVKTYTVIRVAPQGRKPPYIVAMAELEEGPWVIGQLEGVDPNAADLALMGQAVTLGSKVIEGDTYSQECRCLTFRPAV